MEIEHQNTKQYITIIKNLIKHKPSELPQHLPDNLNDILSVFHLTNTTFDELHTFYENINKAADLPNNSDILLPIVHFFLQTTTFNTTKIIPRKLTNAEITTIHYFLLRPNCDILNYRMFQNVVYKRPETTTLMLRCFFFWNGCLCLQYNQIERAEFMFQQCITIPTDIKKPSKIGLEAAKKLMLLQVARGGKISIAAPYANIIPKHYEMLVEKCQKLQIGEINRIISENDKFEKDGNSSLISYVFSQIQFLTLEKIAKAYSIIDVDMIIKKTCFTMSEIKEIVETAEREKGKDWAFLKDQKIVMFGMNHRIKKIENESFMLREFKDLITETCEYIDSVKIEKKEQREKRMKEEKEKK